MNLCGHSIAVDRSSKNRSDILIFGGKETLESESSSLKRITLNSHFTRLNTVSGLISPCDTNTLPPSNRYVFFLLFPCLSCTSDVMNFKCKFISFYSFFLNHVAFFTQLYFWSFLLLIHFSWLFRKTVIFLTNLFGFFL